MDIRAGGNLARLAHPARVITLIMSNIPGDPLNELGGAPTYREIDDNVMGIIERYMPPEELAASVNGALREKINDEALPIAADGQFDFVEHHVIANVAEAFRGMEKCALQLGFRPLKIHPACFGKSKKVYLC